MVFMKQVLALVLIWGLLLGTSPVGANAEAQQSGEDQEPANLSAKEIDNLVSPIALYPDALIAQILAGATYPDQIVEANNFVKANAKLSASDLMTKVDAASWDPSVKALTQFPSVLDNMALNLSWTSALGEASYYQQADVMASVQRLRKQAKAAGNLKTTPQQTVTQQDAQTIIIQPANPQVVYVPTYSTTVVYGTPYYPPGYSTAALVTTGVIAFGIGIAIGASMNNHWGWHSWGCGWRGGTVVYQRNVYVSRSVVFVNGNRPYRGAQPTPYGSRTNVNRSGNRNTNISGNTVNINTNTRSTPSTRQATGNNSAYGANRSRQNNASRPAAAADRGYGKKPDTRTKTGAFSGYSAGGNTRAQSSRGRASYSDGSGRAPQTRSAATAGAGKPQ